MKPDKHDKFKAIWDLMTPETGDEWQVAVMRLSDADFEEYSQALEDYMLVRMKILRVTNPNLFYEIVETQLEELEKCRMPDGTYDLTMPPRPRLQ